MKRDLQRRSQNTNSPARLPRPAPAELDDDLAQRVRLFLASSNIPALRHLSVEVEKDTVLLRGQVQTYYEKQLAVEFSRRVAGVIRVVDWIEVRGYTPCLDGPHTDHWRRTTLEPSPLG